MPDHRMCDLHRSYVGCSCGTWSLKLDRSVTLHSRARADYLIDAWLRHKAQTEAGKYNQGVAE